MGKNKSSTPFLDYLWNMVGVFLVVGGTILFYEGFNTFILSKVSTDPFTQFIVGCIMLIIAYVIFGKKNKIVG